MINENKSNYADDLIKEGYVFDKILTRTLFENVDIIGMVDDDKTIMEAIGYLREKVVHNNNILLAIGWQEENYRRTYGVFIKDTSTKVNQISNEQDMEVTPRGFSIKSFKDTYGKPCSLQKSSSAYEPRIWLGIDGVRMHLNQEQVEMLLPYLQNFVKTGELKKDTTIKYKYLLYENNIAIDVKDKNSTCTSISFNKISTIEEASYTNSNFIISNNTPEEEYFKISTYLNNRLNGFGNNKNITNLPNNFLFTKEAVDYFSKQDEFKGVIFYKLGTTNEKN